MKKTVAATIAALTLAAGPTLAQPGRGTGPGPAMPPARQQVATAPGRVMGPRPTIPPARPQVAVAPGKLPGRGQGFGSGQPGGHPHILPQPKHPGPKPPSKAPAPPRDPKPPQRPHKPHPGPQHPGSQRPGPVYYPQARERDRDHRHDRDTHRHGCHDHKWRGYTRRCWDPQAGYVYWSPGERSWYRWDTAGNTFNPVNSNSLTLNLTPEAPPATAGVSTADAAPLTPLRTVAERSPREPPVRDVLQVEAPVLAARYDANKVASDDYYRGRLVEITGAVGHVGKDPAGTTYVALRGGEASDAACVQCFFSWGNERGLRRLTPGQEVVVQGRCDGKAGNVLVKDCEFVGEPPPAALPVANANWPPAPEVVAAGAEREAAGKLELARDLARAGKTDKARKWCAEIVATFPKTRAAAVAEGLLERRE